MVGLTRHTQRRLLLLANAALVVAIAASLGAAAYLPLSAVGEMPRTDAASPVAEGPSAPRLAPLDTYRVIYQRDLNRPLFDPPPAPVVRAAPPAPQLTLRLIGTVVEPGFTYGVFRTSGGQEKLVTPGETIDGAEVMAIGDGTATVRSHGRVLELKVEKQPPPTRPLGRGLPPAAPEQRP